MHKRQSQKKTHVPRLRGLSHSQVDLRICTQYSTGTLNGNGFVGYVPNTANLASTTQWASFAARYIEFRVKQIKVIFTLLAIGVGAGAGLPVNSGLAVIATDRTGVAGLQTTPAALLAFDAARVVVADPTQKAVEYTARAIDPQNKLYDQTNSPTGIDQFAIQIYGGIAAATAAYNLATEYTVEFKGAK
jgi:hypothetical protein